MTVPGHSQGWGSIFFHLWVIVLVIGLYATKPIAHNMTMRNNYVINGWHHRRWPTNTINDMVGFLTSHLMHPHNRGCSILEPVLKVSLANIKSLMLFLTQLRSNSLLWWHKSLCLILCHFVKSVVPTLIQMQWRVGFSKKKKLMKSIDSMEFHHSCAQLQHMKPAYPLLHVVAGEQLHVPVYAHTD